MSHDYGIYERRELLSPSDWQALPSWDVFISAFNLSERVKFVFDNVTAQYKIWVIHSEYALGAGQLPPEERFDEVHPDESSYCKALLNIIRSRHGFDPQSTRLCIDITGMSRPHLMFMFRYLKSLGAPLVHVIYAEPLQYRSAEDTAFSKGSISAVRPVHGFEGSPLPPGSSDFLIIGAGYDDRLILAVAEHKEKAEKHQIFGLPSLRADMYQQSVLRSRRAADEVGDPDFAQHKRSFAPANDPFGTAAVLSELIERRLTAQSNSNITLSPLGTKPQALGFALYYLFEGSTQVSIIFPFTTGYAGETSIGVARAWLYSVEL